MTDKCENKYGEDTKSRTEIFVDYIEYNNGVPYLFSCMFVINISAYLFMTDMNIQFLYFWHVAGITILEIGVFHLIYSVMKSEVRRIRFKKFISDRTILDECHRERNIQINVMRRVICELYNSKYDKIRDIITKLDNISIDVLRENEEIFQVKVSENETLFCSFKLDSYNRIKILHLSEDHPLYERCNKELYNEI